MKNSKFDDKAFEQALDKAAALAAEELGESVPEPNEEIVFSERHNRRIEQLLSGTGTNKTSRRFIKAAACFLLVLFVGAGAAVGSVEAWRSKFLSFVFDKDAPNTKISVADGVVSGDSDGKYGNNYYIGEYFELRYVPNGFVCEYENFSSIEWGVFGFGNEDKYFDVGVSPINSSPSYDTEQSTMEELSINGYDAVYFSNKNGNILIWHDDNFLFDVTGNIKKKEMVKIAENMELVDDEQ